MVSEQEGCDYVCREEYERAEAKCMKQHGGSEGEGTRGWECRDLSKVGIYKQSNVGGGNEYEEKESYNGLDKTTRGVPE